jgi:hypothetical protein
MPCHTRATRFRDLDETEGNQFPDCGRNCVPVNAVLFEMIVSARQLAIIGSTMMGKLDFEP